MTSPIYRPPPAPRFTVDTLILIEVSAAFLIVLAAAILGVLPI